MTDKKYERLFVYAFYRNDGENGVHEDLCSNLSVSEGVRHAKNLWTNADEYKVSDVQLGAPYQFLFADDRSAENIRKQLTLCEMTDGELEKLVSHLDELNK